MTDFLIMPGANATKQLNQRASIDFKLSSNGMKASKSGSISSSSSSTSSSSSEDNEYHNSVKHESVTVINDEEEEEYDDDEEEDNNNNNEDINEIGSPVSSSKSFSTCSSSNAKNLSSSLNNRRKQIKPIR
jgi:hypothetical protein